MHVAKNNYKDTEGCIALERNDLLEPLERCDSDTRLVIADRPREAGS